MAPTYTPIPAGEAEVTCTQVFSGPSKSGNPQLTLVLKDAEGRTARRYCGIGTRRETERTHEDLKILGWTGDLDDDPTLDAFQRDKPVIGKKAMVRIEPYGEEGKTGVAAMWTPGTPGPWTAEAAKLRELRDRVRAAEPDADADEPATEPSA